jgi:hypothetical protein
VTPAPPSDHDRPPRYNGTYGLADGDLIVRLISLLMSFSVCAMMLGQSPLATGAGTAAIALAATTVRRALRNLRVGPPTLRVDPSRRR